MKNHPDFYKFHKKLPRSQKEFLLFMLVMSLISVNIIAPLNMMFVSGFSWETYLGFLPMLPILWIVVIVVVLATRMPAEMLVNKIVKPTDSFNARIVVDTLCSVLLIAVIMSVVGTWIGMGSVSLDPIVHFFDIFPRAFVISFVVESFLAQPVARLVMQAYHDKKDAHVQPSMAT